MASACVNNVPATTFPSYGWLSPRISNSSSSPQKNSDLESSLKDAGDFEFRLGDNVTMLPADELFSDGKLVPLQFSTPKPDPPPSTPPEEEVRSPELEKSCQSSIPEDPYLFSPKAPRCSSRWREFLGLKKLHQNNNNKEPQPQSKTTSSSSSSSSKSIRHFLNRNSKTSADTSLSLPLLKESSSSSSMDCESISFSSSRLSLSSSSSGHDHDEHPRLSLDAEKPNVQPVRSLSSGPKLRIVRLRENPRMGRTVTRGVSVDSPRMNPSGRVVFQSLERSSSSPSSFNGGPRHNSNNNFKHYRRIMERSYSGNFHVRITPVLNVPVVCSLRGSSKSSVFGFGQLFSSSSSSSSSQSQKKEGNINNNNGSQSNSKSFNQHKEGNNGSNSNFRNKKVKEKEKESS